MCNALSGLTSQAIGAKNFKLAGFWFQHAMFYFTIVSGLMFLMWWQVRAAPRPRAPRPLQAPLPRTCRHGIMVWRGYLLSAPFTYCTLDADGTYS
jgi:hypothetical protein